MNKQDLSKIENLELDKKIQKKELLNLKKS